MRYGKGAKSKTRKGDMDYTTKRGDKVFHRKGKDVKMKRKPFRKRPGGKVKGRTAKPIMPSSSRTVNPPNVYMGGNRASYLAPPPDRKR